jgi:hypothetical protein
VAEDLWNAFTHGSMLPQVHGWEQCLTHVVLRCT